MSENGVLQRAAGLGVGKDLLDIGVRQGRELLGLGALEHILVSHSILSSSVGMSGVLVRSLRLFILSINQLSDDGVDRRLLLLGHAVEDLPKSGVVSIPIRLLVLRVLLGVLDVFRLLHLRVLRLVIIGVRDKVDLSIRIHNSLEFIAVVPMLNGNLVDVCPGVSSSENEANFHKLAVNNIVASGLDMGGIDAHSLDVAVANHLSSGSSGIRVVEMCVSVHPVLSNLQIGMTKDIGNVLVLVLPHQGDGLPVIRRECPVPDHLVIRAPNIVLRGVAGKVAVNCHFDYSPSVRKLASPTRGPLELALHQEPSAPLPD